MNTPINFDKMPTYHFMNIEPVLKRDVKKLNSLRKLLNITEPKEDFVLKCILYFERKKDCVINSIDKVQKSKSLDMVVFIVDCKLPSHTIDYCCSNPLKEEGWSLKTHEERCWHVYHQLHRYICRR